MQHTLKVQTCYTASNMTKPSPIPPKANVKNDLILLFSVPVLVILAAIALVYTPRLFANPSYDFIYSSCTGYSCSTNFSVGADQKIAEEPSNNTSVSADPVLYYYDTSESSSTNITYTQAREHSLLSSQTAPDDYKLTQENGGSGFLFWSSNSDSTSWYLADGLKKKHIDLRYNDDNYSPVNFIGWVQK